MQSSGRNKDSACCMSFILGIFFCVLQKYWRYISYWIFYFYSWPYADSVTDHGQKVTKLFAAAIYLFSRNYVIDRYVLTALPARHYSDGWDHSVYNFKFLRWWEVANHSSYLLEDKRDLLLVFHSGSTLMLLDPWKFLGFSNKPLPQENFIISPK